MNLKKEAIVLFWLLVIILILILIGLIYGIIKRLIQNKKEEEIINERAIGKKIGWNILSILIIIVVIISWFMNLGWIRFLLAIPIIFHTIIFFISNYLYNKYSVSAQKNLINIIGNGVYLFGYILLPDGGDTEDSWRVFFGLIKNELFLNIAGIISELLLVVSIVIIVIQISNAQKIKRKMKRKEL